MIDKEEIAKIKTQWKQVTVALSKQFEEEPDLQVILFLVGVQELGRGNQKFSKDEKQNLMHLATCRLLSDPDLEGGYYAFDKIDEDGWPHYKVIKKLPPMAFGEQDMLLRKAVIIYFQKAGIVAE